MEQTITGETPAIIYVLTNLDIPGYARTGIAQNKQEMQRRLWHSKLPNPSEVYFAAKVARPEFVMDRIRDIFDDKSIAAETNLFFVEAHRVASAIQLAADSVVSEPASIKPDRPKRARKSPFDFIMLDIPLGAVLAYRHDRSITCEVVQRKPPFVQFQGSITNLSTATNNIRNTRRKLRGQSASLWIYEGESLLQRRKRLERESPS